VIHVSYENECDTHQDYGSREGGTAEVGGEVPLGEYVRERILEPRPDDSKPSPTPKPVSGPKPVAPEKPREGPKKKETCAHGRERGYLCGQCGGLARIV
jgi:hypothetical protein